MAHPRYEWRLRSSGWRAGSFIVDDASAILIWHRASTAITPRAAVHTENPGISGYSGIVSVTLPSKLQVAFGVGRYDAPSFLVSGDAHYEQAKWEAAVTSLQVARVTYRFRGAMKSGPAVEAEKIDHERSSQRRVTHHVWKWKWGGGRVSR